MVIADFQRRTKIIAERAFWDSVQWRLSMGLQSGSLPQMLTSLLSELGSDLASVVLDEEDAREVKAGLGDPERVQQQLTHAVRCSYIGMLCLESRRRVGRLLRDGCEPGRFLSSVLKAVLLQVLLLWLVYICLCAISLAITKCL